MYYVRPRTIAGDMYESGRERRPSKRLHKHMDAFGHMIIKIHQEIESTLSLATKESRLVHTERVVYRSRYYSIHYQIFLSLYSMVPCDHSTWLYITIRY